VTTARIPERRAGHGRQLAHALLDTVEPVSFDELVAEAPSATTREVADWLGHAIADGLIAEREPGPDGERRFGLRARGRRVFVARRRNGD
jgi:hypothetical protein